MTEQTTKAERSQPSVRWEPKLTPTIEPLSNETFQRFCKLIYEKTNIRMRESKQVLVSNRLRRRIVALNLKGYDEYYHYLTRGENRAQEIVHFIDAVSTNETYFFREYNHFDALLNLVLPDLNQRKRRLRFWCAGCSTGEEPYTLRIVLEEARAARRVGDVEILATDISHQVIDRAREGEYGERAVRMVPADLMKRHFIEESEGCFRVSRAVQEGVEFRVHNLLGDQPPTGPFDLIFCRNVMIYFDKPTQRRLVDDCFARVLDPKGYLFVGHSESLSGTSQKFRYLREVKAPVYQRKEE